MKKYIFIVSLACLSMRSVKAQSATDAQLLLTTVEQFRLALISGDKNDLEKLVTKNLSYGHSNGKIQNKIEFITALEKGQSDFVTISFDNQTETIAGNTALVRHILNAKTNDSGKPAEVHLGILLVWQKQKNHWKLIGRQAYKLPTSSTP